MRRTSTAIALIASLAISTPAFAAIWTYEQLDADKNLEVTSVEFNAYAADVIETWDADSDGFLSAAEFETFHPEIGLEVNDPFEEWDADGDELLAAGELGTGLFDAYDADDDELFEETEYAELEAVGEVGGPAERVTSQEIVEISEWVYDPLYVDGVSVEWMMDEMEVLGAGGEEIGEVENVLFGADGQVLSIVAEVGGLWDIGDTHISIPWDQVEIVGNESVVVPVTEETVDDYSLFTDAYLTAVEASADIQEVEGDGLGEVTTGPAIWRATELIGDYARLREAEEEFVNYGFINDLIVRDGKIAATVVSPDVGYGASGYYAYPYYGSAWGVDDDFYDLPYAREDVAELEPFEYERLDE